MKVTDERIGAGSGGLTEQDHGTDRKLGYRVKPGDTPSI